MLGHHATQVADKLLLLHVDRGLTNVLRALRVVVLLARDFGFTDCVAHFVICAQRLHHAIKVTFVLVSEAFNPLFFSANGSIFNVSSWVVLMGTRTFAFNINFLVQEFFDSLLQVLLNHGEVFSKLFDESRELVDLVVDGVHEVLVGHRSKDVGHLLVVGMEQANHLGEQVVVPNQHVVVSMHGFDGIARKSGIFVASMEDVSAFPVEELDTFLSQLLLFVTEFGLALVVVESDSIDVVVVGLAAGVVRRDHSVHLVVDRVGQGEALDPLAAAIFLDKKRSLWSIVPVISTLNLESRHLEVQCAP